MKVRPKDFTTVVAVPVDASGGEKIVPCSFVVVSFTHFQTEGVTFLKVLVLLMKFMEFELRQK